MTDVEVLKREAAESFAELVEAIDGVIEEQSWAAVTLKPGEYLHTEGSILSIVVHVGSCRLMYGSAAYVRDGMRWRDCLAHVESFWPSWERAKAYLREAHEYWMRSWAGETDLERLVSTNWGEEWPSWKVIWAMSHHDSYHAGQIELLKAVLEPWPTPPPNEATAWEIALSDSPSW